MSSARFASCAKLARAGKYLYFLVIRRQQKVFLARAYWKSDPARAPRGSGERCLPPPSCTYGSNQVTGSVVVTEGGHLSVNRWIGSTLYFWRSNAPKFWLALPRADRHLSYLHGIAHR